MITKYVIEYAENSFYHKYAEVYELSHAKEIVKMLQGLDRSGRVMQVETDDKCVNVFEPENDQGEARR